MTDDERLKLLAVLQDLIRQEEALAAAKERVIALLNEGTHLPSGRLDKAG